MFAEPECYCWTKIRLLLRNLNLLSRKEYNHYRSYSVCGKEGEVISKGYVSQWKNNYDASHIFELQMRIPCKHRRLLIFISLGR